jgi:thiamine biosynthesis lipoprotein
MKISAHRPAVSLRAFEGAAAASLAGVGRGRAGRRAARPAEALALAVLGAAGPAPGAPASTLDRELAAMGTRLQVRVEAADRRSALAASEAAVRAVEAAEARLSTWRQESELARFNGSAPGLWVALSPALERDLGQAARWWRETGGAFDPGVASLVAAWDLRGRGRVPGADELDAARAAAGLEHFELAEGRARRLAHGFGIEEGGFGKGAALADAVGAALGAVARCVSVELGGQLMVAGDCKTMTVGIAHPRRRGEVVAWLDLRSGSVATSGNSERSVAVGGLRFGHLLDPSTGRPAADWGSVTVVAQDPVAADCLATALYVMGPERGLRWASARPDVAAVFAVADGEALELRATPGLHYRAADAERLCVPSPAAATMDPQ